MAGRRSTVATAMRNGHSVDEQRSILAALNAERRLMTLREHITSECRLMPGFSLAVFERRAAILRRSMRHMDDYTALDAAWREVSQEWAEGCYAGWSRDSIANFAYLPADDRGVVMPEDDYDAVHHDRETQ